MNCFCDFCDMSHKAITTICEWCRITIQGYINNPDSSVRLLQLYVLLIFVSLCRNLGPQKLNFDISPYDIELINMRESIIKKTCAISKITLDCLKIDMAIA